MRPQNYQELQQAAIRELKLKQLELEERAENIARLIQNFHSITDWNHPERCPEFCQVDDNNDLPDRDHLRTMIINGQACQTLPGQGYW